MMAISTCVHCGNNTHWNWEEAFHKYGFNGGRGQIETWDVIVILRLAGYTVDYGQLGEFNIVIVSISKNGIEYIGYDVSFGYDHPRAYLPEEIVRLLDRKFPSDTVYLF